MATQMNEVELIRQLVVLFIDDAVDIFGELGFVHLFDNADREDGEISVDREETVPLSRTYCNNNEVRFEGPDTIRIVGDSDTIVREIQKDDPRMSDSDSLHSMQDSHSKEIINISLIS